MDHFPEPRSSAPESSLPGVLPKRSPGRARSRALPPAALVGIIAYLVCFFGSVLVQGGLSSTHHFTGIIAQFQVLISVLLVVMYPRPGYFVAMGANITLFVFLSGLYRFNGDAGLLTGLFVYVSAMIMLSVIALFGHRLAHQHGELARSKEHLSRLLLEVAEAGQRSAFLASHDELTGLANARNLRARLADHYADSHPQRPGGGLALIKLGNLKLINSIFGPNVGDALIEAVADRLRVFAQVHGYHAARVESSTFALFFPSATAIERPLRDALEKVRQQLDLDEGSLEVQACAGYAECGDDADDPETLFRCAEFALGSAKEAGCHMIRIFDGGMARQARRRLAIVNELERALARDEFSLCYQPQIDTRSGRIVGAEALIRWHNARLGCIPPDEFIPIAEQNGQILAIGSWVLERACRDASQWPAHWSVSVNVSTGQFLDRGLESQIAAALANSGLRPSRLTLEITESVLIGDEATVIEILARLRARHVAVAMDDFGTGYSSLSYLKNIPLDELKIDRAFITAMEDDARSRAIVETIIHLARQLNLSTTTEGVETGSQARILRELGCTRLQGYLYGKPMPVDVLLARGDDCVF